MYCHALSVYSQVIPSKPGNVFNKRWFEDNFVFEGERDIEEARQKLFMSMKENYDLMFLEHISFSAEFSEDVY